MFNVAKFSLAVSVEFAVFKPLPFSAVIFTFLALIFATDDVPKMIASVQVELILTSSAFILRTESLSHINTALFSAVMFIFLAVSSVFAPSYTTTPNPLFAKIFKSSVFFAPS